VGSDQAKMGEPNFLMVAVSPALSSRSFNAAAGTKLMISVAKSGSEALPPGDLIIVASWLDTKDKLVGIMLDKEFRKISTAAIVSGLVLISLAAWLTWRRSA
jgi:hypothetical protein